MGMAVDWVYLYYTYRYICKLIILIEYTLNRMYLKILFGKFLI